MAEATRRILLFIPAYRCAAQIVRVIDQFDEGVAAWIDTVLLVDNRSPDDTLASATARARAKHGLPRLVALRNVENYGLGGSHKVAYEYAERHGFDFLVVLHGDDQADIHDLIPLLSAGRHLEKDCLLGARFAPGSRLQGYSRFRTIGNRAFNWLFSRVAGKEILDLGSGLNMYRVSALRGVLRDTFPDDLTFNYVFLLGLIEADRSIDFFPISWREEDQRSNVKLVRQAIRVLWILLSYAVGRRRFLDREMRTHSPPAYQAEVVAELAESGGTRPA